MENISCVSATFLNIKTFVTFMFEFQVIKLCSPHLHCSGSTSYLESGLMLIKSTPPLRSQTEISTLAFDTRKWKLKTRKYTSAGLFERLQQRIMFSFVHFCLCNLTCLNLSHLQRTLHLTQYTYQDFFLQLKTVFEFVNFWFLSLVLPFFCFTSSTSAKHFSLRIFFMRGNNKKLLGVRLGE